MDRVLDAPASRARRLVIFGVIGLSMLLFSMSITVVAVALPDISAGLDASLSWVGWTITGFQLGQAVSLALAGRIGDRFGLKPVFVASVGAFVLGSLACGLSNDAATLIFFRVFSAVAGGAFMPIAAGIVSEQFPHNRAQALGLFSSIFPIGGILGPNVGGYLVQEFSWRWAFLMNVPLGVVALVLAVWLIKVRRPRVDRPMDIPGAALMSGGILGFMLAFTLIGERGYGIPLPLLWGLLGGSVVILYLFWRHEQRTEAPIVDLELLRLKPFVAANLFNAGFGAIFFSLNAFIPLYAVTAYGFSTFESGLVLTGRAVTMIVVSAITSVYLLKRFSYRILMHVGVGLISVGTLLLSLGLRDIHLFGVGISDFWMLTTVLAITGIGTGLVNPPSNNAGMDMLPSKVAAITGLRGLFRSAGGVAGTTLIFFALAGFADGAQGLSAVFLVLALLMPLNMIAVAWMPTGAERSMEDESEPARLPGPARA